MGISSIDAETLPASHRISPPPAWANSMWEKLPIIIHCTEFKNPQHFQRSLKENLFGGLDPRQKVMLAKEIYTDASRFLACTGAADSEECRYCAKIIKLQREIAQEILRETSIG